MYGSITVTLADGNGARTVTFATATAGGHCDLALALRYMSVPGTDVLEELLFGAAAPPGAMTEADPLAVELVSAYESMPGGVHNPHNLMDVNDDDV